MTLIYYKMHVLNNDTTALQSTFPYAKEDTKCNMLEKNILVLINNSETFVVNKDIVVVHAI
jgi:hypothetical protein